MAEEKPTTAFVLSLIGSIFMLLVSAVIAVAASILQGFLGLAGFGFLGPLMAIGYLPLVFAVIALIGAIIMWSSDRGRVRLGGILVLIFSILNLLTPALGGIIIGFILGLVGGILAIIWHPRERMAAPPPPAPA